MSTEEEVKARIREFMDREIEAAVAANVHLQTEPETVKKMLAALKVYQQCIEIGKEKTLSTLRAFRESCDSDIIESTLADLRLFLDKRRYARRRDEN